MSRCARCDFEADDLAEHAAEAGHYLCIVCQRRSLTVHERQTCATCVAAVRADLADILEAVALLEPSSVVGLTLLGDGTMQRHPHEYELRSRNAQRHPLAADDEPATPKPIRDEWDSDPLPVLAALASWEDYLRSDYGDEKGAVPANLSATVDYLTINLDSRHNFAQTFPGFDDLAREIRHHRGAGTHAAGLADDPLEAEADCFDCGGPLLRTYAPPTELDEERARRIALKAYIEACDDAIRAARAASRSASLIRREQNAALALLSEPRPGRAREGLTDDWTCGWCRRVYNQTSYFLALRAKASSWVPIPLAAETTQRSIWTVRSWARRGLVTAACRVLDRAVLVWWPDVSDRAFRHADDTQQRSA
jgi:hypothetical protein